MDDRKSRGRAGMVAAEYKKEAITALLILFLVWPCPLQRVAVASDDGLCPPGPKASASVAQIEAVSGVSEAGFWNRLTCYFGHTFPGHLIQGARKSFWGKNLVFLAIGGGAAGVLLTVDDDIDAWFRHEKPLGQGGQEIGSFLGSPPVLFGAAGASYLVGEFYEIHAVRETSEVALEAISLTGITSALLKLATQRERPDKSNSLSFPSFHAAGSFAVAASLHETLGYRASVPAFLTATFISLARIQKQKHYLSDTLFGALLGTVVGITMGKLHRKLATARVKFLPYSDKNLVGMQLCYPF